MSWFLRFAGWATLLAFPCWLLSRDYQRVLAAVVTWFLPLFGHARNLGHLDVAAPFDLGLFIALCLASRQAPASARARALVLGIPLMLALEVFLVAAGLGIILRFQDRAETAATAIRAAFSLVDTIPWVSAALVWLVLLGRWTLPLDSARRGRAGAAPAARTPAPGPSRGPSTAGPPAPI